MMDEIIDTPENEISNGKRQRLNEDETSSDLDFSS